VSEQRCRFVASDQPRTIVGRHEDDCADEGCRGCLPCPMDHCRRCGVTHASGACPGCLTEVREGLTELGRMTAALPAETAVRGVEGEAFNLLGPSANPEARGHLEASVRAGRVPPEYLEVADDERHPLFMAATWAAVYREAFEHDEPTGRVTLAEELAYLDRHLSEAGEYEWVPFEDFARDVAASVTHLERVLHDGEQVDRGVPCMTCKRPLTRVWGYGSKQDGWECKHCREFSTEDQYRFAVKADYIARAEWLTDVDMTVRTGVKSGTVRVWAQREKVARRLDSGRIVYSVADVEARRGARSIA
jgi:hypothetical protein